MAAYLSGFASLLEQVDKRVIVLLRDGRSLIGILRSVDQFANLVLGMTVERIYVGNECGEIDRGVFLVRGENVVLCGEIDEEKDAESCKAFKKVPVEEILASQRRKIDERRKRERLRMEALHDRGLIMLSDIGMSEDFADI